jgi:ATP-binding cassette subfamily B protein
VSGIRTVRAFSQEAAEGARYDRQIARALEFAKRKIARAELAACHSLPAMRRAPGHLDRRKPHRHRPVDHGRADLVHPVRAARRARVPQRLAILSRIARADGATQWIFELLGRTARIPTEGGERPAGLDGSIVFEAIRFRYRRGPMSKR